VDVLLPAGRIECVEIFSDVFTPRVRQGVVDLRVGELGADVLRDQEERRQALLTVDEVPRVVVSPQNGVVLFASAALAFAECRREVDGHPPDPQRYTRWYAATKNSPST
jgi:hypothetical protein